MSLSSGFSPCGLITLTTDFGPSDGYVGAMKGVILTRAPQIQIHDIAHAIAPQNVAHGAAALRTAAPWFPIGTVHVGVVDPGVGTARAGLLVLAGGHAFVGPDNGLFVPVADVLGGPDEVRRLDTAGALASVVPPRLSATFHGRDVFAPTAAALADGSITPMEVGPPHELAALEALPAVGDRTATGIGQITHVDHFGNAITNIGAEELSGPSDSPARVEVAGHTLEVVRTYGEVGEGSFCALVGSEGFLEIAVRGGSAAKALGIGPGTVVRVRPR